MAYRLTPLLLLALLCVFAHCEVTKVIVEGEKLELEKTNENLGPEYRLKREPIALTCIATTTGKDDLKLIWDVKKNDRIDISDTEKESDGDKEIYKSTLTISEPADEDITMYTCTVMKGEEFKRNASGTFHLPPLITLTVNSKAADDYTPDSGEPTEIKCEIKAYPQPVTVRWEKELNGELKQLAVPEANSRVLKLPAELNYETDRAIFTCAVNNTVGYNSAKLFLRVRNPLAFLIPLVAIIVEIVLIVIIVIAYEISMRRKRAAAGDDTKTD